MTLEPITIHQLDGMAAKAVRFETKLLNESDPKLRKQYRTKADQLWKAVEEGENARRDAGFKLYED